MIRKLRSGQYRLYSRKKDPRTGLRASSAAFVPKPYTSDALTSKVREVLDRP
jgi:hypothetical protein